MASRALSWGQEIMVGCNIPRKDSANSTKGIQALEWRVLKDRSHVSVNLNLLVMPDASPSTSSNTKIYFYFSVNLPPLHFT